MLEIKQTIGNFEVRAVADSFVECVKLLSSPGECLKNTKCKQCGGTSILLHHRLNKSYHFYELHCASCESTLKLGSLKDESGGGLYPDHKKINDDNSVGDYDKDNDGWRLPYYKRSGQANQAPAQSETVYQGGPQATTEHQDLPF